MRATKSPDLAYVLVPAAPRAKADGRHMIFEFAETAPLAVHVARLHHEPEISGFRPGHVNVLARGIDKEVTDDQGCFISAAIEVANASGEADRAQADLVLALRRHPIAHQLIRHDQIPRCDAAHIDLRSGAREGRN